MNDQQRARRQQAEDRLEAALEGIPGNDEIFNVMVTDFILNVVPADMKKFKVKHMKQAAKGAFEEDKVPNITDKQYIVMTKAFKRFVREYYGQEGGKHTKTRRHKRRTNKTRKH